LPNFDTKSVGLAYMWIRLKDACVCVRSVEQWAVMMKGLWHYDVRVMQRVCTQHVGVRILRCSTHVRECDA